MKRLLTIILSLAIALALEAGTKEDSLFVTSVLKDAPSANALYFARKFLDRPYVAHTLEVNSKESLVVNTRELDCTTLVENVTALMLCVKHNERTYQAFKHYLTQLRYRQGQLDGYASRLHYFSDWIVDNTEMGFVSEIQSPESVFTARQKLDIFYMSKHPQSYKALSNAPKVVEEIARQELALTGKTFRYIPKAQVRNTKALRNAVKNGDIIAITCSKPGLDIAHLGFAVWRDDGLHLLNASQLHKKVVEEPMTLGTYLSKHLSHTGIRIIRIK